MMDHAAAIASNVPKLKVEISANGSLSFCPRCRRVGANGEPFWIEPLSLDDEEGLSFVRTRLEKETDQLAFTLIQGVKSRDKCIVYVARQCSREADDAMQDAKEAVPASSSSGPLIAAVVLDVSTLLTTRAIGISWLTVLFAYRHIHVGRALVRHAEACAASLGARSVQVPGAVWTTTLFTNLGYRSSQPRIDDCPHIGKVYGSLRYIYKLLVCGESTDGQGTAPPTDTRNGRHVKPEGRKPKIKEEEDGKAAGDRLYPATGPSGKPRKLSTEKPRKNARAAPDTTKAFASRKKSAAGDQLTATPTTPSVTFPLDENGARAASRKLSQKHSNEDEAIVQGPPKRPRRHVQYFDYTIPAAPTCVVNGDVSFRLAQPGDKRAWNSLILAACHYNMGGSSMLQVTWEAACRIVACKAADKRRVVGLIAMQSSGWISFLACDAACQGGGIGSFLLFLAMEWLRVRDGAMVSLTPLNRKVMPFYERWEFHAYPCDDRKKGTPVDASDYVMERQIDREVRLLPDGKPLAHFIADYDATDEAEDTTTWHYYFYSTPKKTKRQPDGSSDGSCGPSDSSTLPQSATPPSSEEDSAGASPPTPPMQTKDTTNGTRSSKHATKRQRDTLPLPDEREHKQAASAECSNHDADLSRTTTVNPARQEGVPCVLTPRDSPSGDAADDTSEVPQHGSLSPHNLLESFFSRLHKFVRTSARESPLRLLDVGDTAREGVSDEEIENGA